MLTRVYLFVCFFFNDTATTEIYTLSLHDALPISRLGHYQPRRHRHGGSMEGATRGGERPYARHTRHRGSHVPLRKRGRAGRSEEHTSELQSRQYLVCRLLLEKKKTKANIR